jgi:rRNA-processing protein FCF1
MNILPDTNFLIYCAKQKIDFIREFERLFHTFRVYIIDAVYYELKNLSEKEKGKDKQYARLSIEIVKRLLEKGVILSSKSDLGEADDILLSFDNKENVIATSDKALKERFKNAQILTIRQKRYLFLS